jgi:hypothetical protein
MTKSGRRCRTWTLRETPPGEALCSFHARRTRRPPRAYERCTAITLSGEPCGGWAAHGSAAQYGAGLCPVHLPKGDGRKIGWRLPGPGERRCTALNRHGERCPQWAIAKPRDGDGGEEARDLCWIHAFPHLNGNVRHGFYRAVPHFTPAQQAAILRIAEEGAPLTAEVLLVRLKLREAFAYLSRNDVSGAEMNHVALLILQGVRTVSRLLGAQAALTDVYWGPYSAGGAGKMLDSIKRRENV